MPKKRRKRNTNTIGQSKNNAQTRGSKSWNDERNLWTAIAYGAVGINALLWLTAPFIAFQNRDQYAANFRKERPAEAARTPSLPDTYANYWAGSTAFASGLIIANTGGIYRTCEQSTGKDGPPEVTSGNIYTWTQQTARKLGLPKVRLFKAREGFATCLTREDIVVTAEAAYLEDRRLHPIAKTLIAHELGHVETLDFLKYHTISELLQSVMATGFLYWLNGNNIMAATVGGGGFLGLVAFGYGVRYVEHRADKIGASIVGPNAYIAALEHEIDKDTDAALKQGLQSRRIVRPSWAKRRAYIQKLHNYLEAEAKRRGIEIEE